MVRIKKNLITADEVFGEMATYLIYTDPVLFA